MVIFWLLLSIVLLVEKIVAASFDRVGDLQFASPVHGAFEPATDNFFIVEQAGRIHRIVAGKSSVFLDITDRVQFGGERGLLSMAIHSNYGRATSPFFGRVFVNYTRQRNSSSATFVASFRKNRESEVIQIPQPYGNHNGGMIAFGPEGYLYVGMGDGGAGGDPHGHGQNSKTLLGAMLRLDVQPAKGYRVPADNPRGDGKGRPEIHSWGWRNPWRFSFDRQTGDLWVGDVGQHEIESIYIAKPGGNHGWNVLEGSRCFRDSKCRKTGTVLPVYEYGREEHSALSVVGGYVYRGKNCPMLRGQYLFTEFYNGKVYSLAKKGKVWQRSPVWAGNARISSFFEDSKGEIYAVDYSHGHVLRMTCRG